MTNADDTDFIPDPVAQALDESPVDRDRVDVASYSITHEPVTARSWGSAAAETYTTTARLRITAYDPDAGTEITVKTTVPYLSAPSDRDGNEDDGRAVIRLAAEDDWDDEACAVCGQAWDPDVWDVISRGGDAYGGMAIHECPQPHCDGRATVTY